MIESLSHHMFQKIYTRVYAILITQKYLHFFLTGTTGVALNLATTWFFTTYVFGLAGYFKAYIIGTSVNLLYNFTLHTIVTFRTKTRHASRLVIFVAYSLAVTALNASVVKYVTDTVGHQFYLIVIATTIFVFSTVSFVVFKFFLFREKPPIEFE